MVDRWPPPIRSSSPFDHTPNPPPPRTPTPGVRPTDSHVSHDGRVWMHACSTHDLSGGRARREGDDGRGEGGLAHGSAPPPPPLLIPAAVPVVVCGGWGVDRSNQSVGTYMDGMGWRGGTDSQGGRSCWLSLHARRSEPAARIARHDVGRVAWAGPIDPPPPQPSPGLVLMRRIAMNKGRSVAVWILWAGPAGGENSERGCWLRAGQRHQSRGRSVGGGKKKVSETRPLERCSYARCGPFLNAHKAKQKDDTQPGNRHAGDLSINFRVCVCV